MVVLLLLVAVYCYFSFSKYNASKDRIHADAELIIKVDTDRLYSTLAMDYFSNPSYYQNKSIESIESGLKIPAQIFVYTVKSKSDQTYFCTLPVADTVLLKSFIKEKLGITAVKNMGQYITGSSSNGRLSIAFNTHMFVAGYSLNGEKVENVIADLLNKRNLLPNNDQLLIKLKGLKAHLAYVFKDCYGTGDFKDGQLHLEGSFSSEHFDVKGKTFSHRTFDKDAIIKMWFNVTPSLNKSYAGFKVKSYDVYPDSLLRYCNGYFDIEMGKTVHQVDTIITYEYNDDFEKEEIVTPRNVTVPGINSVMASHAKGLIDYLSKSNIIVSGQVNKELFPLYRLYAKSNETTVMLSTDRNAVISASRENTPYFFYLGIDFEQLKEQAQFPLLEKYIKPLSRLVIKANPESSHKNHFEVDLDFKRKDINALGQLP